MAEIVQGGATLEWAVPFTWFGWVGVQIFFVLSGFVIAFSLRGTALDFGRRRFLRLYPTAWICVLITLVLLAAVTDMPAQTLLAGALRSATLWPSGPWIVGVYWTLPVELSFYVLVGTLSATIGQGRLPLAMMALTVWSGAYWALKAIGAMPVLDAWIANVFLLTYGANFALGALIWHCVSERRHFFWILAACAAAGVSVISILPKAIALGRVHGQLPVVPAIVWLLAVVGILLAIRCNETVIRITGDTWLRRVGQMTYPLYLLHIPVGGVAMFLGNRLGLSGIFSLLLGILASIAVSWWVAMWADPQLQRLFRAKKVTRSVL